METTEDGHEWRTALTFNLPINTILLYLIYGSTQVKRDESIKMEV